MTPTQSDELLAVLAECHQVIGVLAHSLGVFDSEAVTKALDNAASGKLIHKDVLPFTIDQCDEWHSNIGRDMIHLPNSLCTFELIEVKYRNGETDIDYADSWISSWKETDNDPLDIVAYRILPRKK